jgi:hypothetical protein
VKYSHLFVTFPLDRELTLSTSKRNLLDPTMRTSAYLTTCFPNLDLIMSCTTKLDPTSMRTRDQLLKAEQIGTKS